MRTRVTPTLAVVLASSFALACGSNSSPTSPSPTPTTPTTPGATTAVLDGVVSETAPTTDTAVPGATLRITDGANAGRTATTDGNGYYVFRDLTPGAVTLTIEASGYQAASDRVSVPTNGRHALHLQPNRQDLDYTRSNSLSGGDTVCRDLFVDRPCKGHPFGVHYDGTIEADLYWTGEDNDLDLALFVDGREIAADDDVNNYRTHEQTAHISSSVRAGQTYSLRVIYYRGETVQPFTVRIRRPN